MSTTPGMHVAEVRLLVDDFTACFVFYRDVLGIPVTYGDDSGPYASFDVGGTTVALFSRALQAAAMGTLNNSDGARGLDRVALVLDVGDVDATAREMEGRGAAFVSSPTDQSAWGGRVAHLRDPDGTLIELYQQIARNEAADAALGNVE